MVKGRLDGQGSEVAARAPAWLFGKRLRVVLGNRFKRLLAGLHCFDGEMPAQDTEAVPSNLMSAIGRLDVCQFRHLRTEAGRIARSVAESRLSE